MSPAHTSQPPDGLSEAVLLDAYADGALSPEAAAWVEARLAERPDWRERLERTRALMTALRTQLPPAPPALSDARLDDLLEAARVNSRTERRNFFWSPYLLVPAALLMITLGALIFAHPLLESRGYPETVTMRKGAGSPSLNSVSMESDTLDFPARGREEAVAPKEMGGAGTFGLGSSAGGEGRTGAYYGNQLRPQDAMSAGKPASPGGGAKPDAARYWDGRTADVVGGSGDHIGDRKSDDRAGQPVDRTDAPVSVEMKIEKKSKQAESLARSEMTNRSEPADKDAGRQSSGFAGRATASAGPAPATTPAAPPAPAASPMPAKPMAAAAPAEPQSDAPARWKTKGGTNDDGGAKKGKPGLRGSRGNLDERSSNDFAATGATAAESSWEAEAARSTISEARKNLGVKLREDLADGDLTKLLKERDQKPSDEPPALTFERSKDREQIEGLVGDSEAGAKQIFGARASGGRKRSLGSGGEEQAAQPPAFQRIDELAKSMERDLKQLEEDRLEDITNKSGLASTKKSKDSPATSKTPVFKRIDELAKPVSENARSSQTTQPKASGNKVAAGTPVKIKSYEEIQEEAKLSMLKNKNFETSTDIEIGGLNNILPLKLRRFIQPGKPLTIAARDNGTAPVGGVVVVEMKLTTTSGDEETLALSPNSVRDDLFTNNIPTTSGVITKGDGILQVQPGDQITAKYSDRYMASRQVKDPGEPTIIDVVLPTVAPVPVRRSPTAIANLLSAAASGNRRADLDALDVSVDSSLVERFDTAPAPSSASAIVPRGRVLVATARAIGGQVRLDAGRIVVGEPRPFDLLDSGGLDAEQFRAAFGTAPFIDTTRDYRHTVAITADTASFDRARNDLAKNRSVDPLGIQVEHFVNAVPFAWPVAAPGAAEAFTLSAEGGAVALGQTADAAEPAADRMLVAVGLQANPAQPEQRRALRLTVAVDASGSMARPGGIDRIRAGLRELQRQLKPDDRLAIVAFADQARVVLPSTAASDAGRIHAALAGITPQGATNAADGLALAYQLAAETATGEAVSRVVLATDGATLVGDIDRTVLQVAGWRAKRIPLLIVGCGEERYEAAALDRLAQAGDGEHLFLGSDAEAIQVFRTRLLPERLSVLGRDAKLQVVWNPLRVAHARLVGFDTRRLRHQDFRDDSVQAGALAEASRVTALFEVRLATGAATGPLGAAHVRYHDTRRDAVRELICPLPGSLISSNASSRLRVAACAAQLGEILGATWWANAGALRAAPLATELERIGRDPAVDGELGRFAGELRLMAEAAARSERKP